MGCRYRIFNAASPGSKAAASAQVYRSSSSLVCSGSRNVKINTKFYMLNTKICICSITMQITQSSVYIGPRDRTADAFLRYPSTKCPERNHRRALEQGLALSSTTKQGQAPDGYTNFIRFYRVESDRHEKR